MGITNRSKNAAAAVAVSVVAMTAASPASAATQSFFSVFPDTGDALRFAALTLFDPALGTLTQVEYEYKVGVVRSPVTVSHDNLDVDRTVVYTTLGGDLNIAAPGLVVNELLADEQVLVILANTDGPTEFYPGDLSVAGIGFPEGVFLSQFVGVGTFEFSFGFEPLDEAEPLPDGVTASAAELLGGGYLGVTYTFDPVPLPAAAWLFASGLGVLAAARYRRSA